MRELHFKYNLLKLRYEAWVVDPSGINDRYLVSALTEEEVVGSQLPPQKKIYGWQDIVRKHTVLS